MYHNIEKLGDSQYKFIIKDKPVYILWAPGPIPAEITGIVRVTDIRGQEREMKATDITLTATPLLVSFK